MREFFSNDGSGMNITSQRFFGNLSKTYGGMFFSDSYNSEHCGGVWGCFKYWKNYYDNSYFLTTYNALIKSGGFLIGTVSSQINNNTVAQNTAINSIAQLSKSTTFNQFDRFTITQTGIINLDLSRIISAINNNSSQKSIQSQAIEFRAPNLIAEIQNDAIQQISLQKISSEEISENLISTTQLPKTELSTTPQPTIISDKINLGSLSINNSATLSTNPLTPLVEARSQFTNIENYYGSDYLFIKLGLTKSQFLTQLEEAANKVRLEAEALRKASDQSTSEFLTNQLSQQLNQAQSTSPIPWRFLGDSFTESKLLKEQLSSIRKDAMMLDEDGEGGEEEIKSLLNNTASEFSRLNLKLDEVATKGLTEVQINSLEKNIITFEAMNLNGMTVVVPKIYLSLKTREKLAGTAPDEGGALATSSTIFAKGDLTLNSPTANLLNSGSIISGKNMVMNLSSLKNKSERSSIAEIKSSQNLTITAFGDEGIKNLGAKILTTNDLRLTTLRGSVINSSLVQTNDANLLASSPDSYQLHFGDSARTSGNISSNLISTASLTAKNISINSAKDFSNLAAKILTTKTLFEKEGGAAPAAGGDLTEVGENIAGNISITAGNDINIGTLQLHNRTEESWGGKKGGGTRITDSTTNLASEISSAGNISLNSNADLNIVGSNVTAADSINLQAANDVNISAAQNASFSQSTSYKKGFSTSKSSGEGSAAIKNIHSNLTSESGDIIIASGADTNLIGANLNSAKNTEISSLGETNIASVTDSSSSYSYSNKSSKGLLNHIPVIPKIITAVDNILLGWPSKILNTVSDDSFKKLLSDEKTRVNTSGSNQEIQTANLTSEENITIDATNNLNIKSSNLKAVNGDMNLASNQNINITSDQAISGSNRTEDGKTDHKSIKSNLENSQGKTISSTLTAENITLTSANDITLQAVKIKAEEGVNVNAGNNLLLTTAQDFSTSSETNKSKTTYAKSLGNSGSINTEILNTEISSSNQSPINLKLDAGNLIYAEFNSANSQNLNYLTALDPAKSILNPLTELHSSYSQTNRSLTQTGQAVVAIAAVAVVVVSAGAGLAAAGAATATAAGATAGGAVAVGAGAGTVVAASTAASIAATSATNASMNADGSAFNQLKTINKTAFKDTTSKESLQQIAIAATTAALAAGASQAAGLGNATNGANAASTAPSTLERVATNLSTGLQKATIYSTSNILATSAIKGQSIDETIEQQGGGEKILLNSAIQALGEVGAKEIGILAHANTIDKATQLALHGAIGCAIGSASGNCAAGAAGAVAGEVVGEKYFKSKLDENGIQTAKDESGRDVILLNSSSPEAYNQDLQTLTQIKFQTTELSKLVGAIAAIPFATANGKDDASAVYVGAGAARNSVENNTIKVLAQPVALGFYHTLTKHEPNPEDQKFFEVDPRYQRNPETGKLYATFGGGPDKGPFGNLIGDINRSRDIDISNKVYESENLVSPESDIYQASRLYSLTQSYKDNLPYEFFPTKTSEGYNSNSFNAGLLNASDITPPTLPKYIINPTPWQDWEYPERSPKISYPVPMPTPGYEKPVPKEFFGVRE